MRYFRCDYPGEKKTVTVMVEAEDVRMADTLVRNYMESFLIPRFGPPKSDDVSVFEISSGEYWTTRQNTRNLFGDPYFINPT